METTDTTAKPNTTSSDPAIPAGTTEVPTTESPKTDSSETPEQGNLFPKEDITETPEPESKVDETEDTDKEDPETNDEESKEEEGLSLEDMGYGNLGEEQQGIAQMAVDAGIKYDDLVNAMIDGRLDVTKFEDVPAKDLMVLKTVVDAEYSRLKSLQTERLSEFHGHVGGEANYNAMIEFVNSKMKSDPEFKAEAIEMRGLMSKGGKSAKIAVTSLFDAFKADPSTSLPMVDGETATTGVASTDSRSTREKLDAGWTALQNKHKFK